MRKLKKREKRALIGGGGVALLFLLVSYVVLPFFDASAEIGGDLDQKQTLLQRSVASIEQEAVYEAELDQLDAVMEEYQRKLLDAQDVNIGKIQLEELVRSLAAQQGVTITRSNPNPERKIGESYVRITLQINLQCEMDQLTSFLYALSTHPKYLLVDEFYLNSFTVRNQIRLQPRMNISGYIRLS